MKTFKITIALVVLAATVLFALQVKTTMDQSETSGHAVEVNKMIDGDF